MTSVLDDHYLSWLYDQVGGVRVRNKSGTYWDLFRQLYSKQFIWLVPNDDNRVQDGLDLRWEYVSQMGVQYAPDWLEGPGCSFLEMLVALSRRLAFEGEGHPPTWFWHLIENLGLHECTDRPKYNQRMVDDVLDNVIWRTYEPNGHGGLFPLRYPKHDQREVELWYQMSEYLLDA